MSGARNRGQVWVPPWRPPADVGGELFVPRLTLPDWLVAVARQASSDDIADQVLEAVLRRQPVSFCSSVTIDEGEGTSLIVAFIFELYDVRQTDLAERLNAGEYDPNGSEAHG